MYKLLKKKEADEIIRDRWKKVGKDYLIQQKDIADNATQLNYISGSTISTNHIRKNIQQAQLRSVSERGRVSLTKMDYQPQSKTLHNHAALTSRKYNRSITTLSITKTCKRYTTENSLISMM